jgi:tetratricopeptide (TPR) repeat protein
MRAGLSIVVVAAVLLPGCAARSVRFNPEDLAHAGGLVRQGCYECLLDARDLYERVAASGRQQAVALRLFEVNLLIALREKELALDPAASLARAVESGFSRTNVGSGFSRILEIVRAVPSDARGSSKKTIGEYLTRLLQPEFRPRAVEWLRQGSPAGAGAREEEIQPIIREYIALALECGRDALAPRQAAAAISTDVPLLRFRAAICPALPDAAVLESLRTENPRFLETGLWLARASLVMQQGGTGTISSKSLSTTRGFLESARSRFSESPAVAYELGVVAQLEGDLRRAATHYGETVTLRPDHEDARLGRAMASSYLKMPEQAIADATVLIDSNAYNRGDAFYWRAFNLHRAKDLAAARADIERAKSIISNSRVHTLAGIIEHDQGERDAAIADLTLAVKLDRANCQASWYLGVVRHAGEEWVQTGTAFAEAARCYDLSAARSERLREEMATRTDVEEDFRTRQLAGFDAAIQEDRTQESAAALNAAIGYARAGDRGTAEKYLEQASKDPARRLMVADLRQVMRGPQ